MNADLYLQGKHWCSFKISPESLLGYLAQGLMASALREANKLQRELTALEGVTCSISIRVKEPAPIPEPPGD